MFADRHISISLASQSRDQRGLTPRQSDAQLHIVTDNKTTCVETGSTLFPGKTSTFSPKAAEVKWAALGYNTFVTSVTRTHSLDCTLLSCMFDCGEEMRASVHSLVSSTLGAIWSIWQILRHLPPFICLKDYLEQFGSIMLKQQNERSESSFLLQ